MLNKIFPSRKMTLLIILGILGALGGWLALHFTPPVPMQRQIERPLSDFLPHISQDGPTGASQTQL